MSAEIRNIGPSGGAVVIDRSFHDDTCVYVEAYGRGSTLPRADFLAAVAKECGVAIVDPAAFPVAQLRDRGEVSFDYGQQGHTEPIPAGLDADELIALGLALKARPKVDEAQVEALADLLARDPKNSILTDEGIRPFARRLLATGRIEVKP